MKRLKKISTILFLMIILAGCTGKTETSDNIYDKIHKFYYDIKSYSTNCSITTFTKASQNTYDCKVDYNQKDENYTVTSDDMKIFLTKEKCVISKGENTIESPAVKEDMYIFINTFFKSYYESEDTVLAVNSNSSADTVLLECSAVNPSKYVSCMKLWINKNNVLPQKMEIIDKEGSVNTEILFRDFKFAN